MDIISVNNVDYEIVRLLGKGKGGYSYLAIKDGKEYVLKQIHHEPCSYYQFGDKIQSEINDYKRLSDIGLRIPKMIDVDVKNERILKEYIDGDTIYDLVCRDMMTEDYISQVRECAAFCIQPTPISITFLQISLCVTARSITSILNATITWMNGILKTGESNTGQKPRNSCSTGMITDSNFLSVGLF